MNKVLRSVVIATAVVAAVAVYAAIQALAINPDLLKNAVAWGLSRRSFSWFESYQAAFLSM